LSLPPDIDDGIQPVAGSLIYGNNIITGAVVLSNAIGLHSTCHGKQHHQYEWRQYNGDPPASSIPLFLIGIFCCCWKRMGTILPRMCPWIAVAYSATPAAATAVFPDLPNRARVIQRRDAIKSAAVCLMLVFQAEHNILMYPFHQLGE